MKIENKNIKTNEERRVLVNSKDYELRAYTSTGETEFQKQIIGYASVFNQESKPLTMYDSLTDKWIQFKELISSTAFNNTDFSNCIYCIDHDPSKLVARTAAKNLELRINENGLMFKATLPNTTVACDLWENIQVGNYFENSFLFKVREGGDQWAAQADGSYIRTINDFEYVKDVSTVVDGAYSNTLVANTLGKVEIEIEPETEVGETEIEMDSIIIK